MKCISFIWIYIFCSLALFAQKEPKRMDSLLNSESKIEKIQKLRSLMIDAVIEEDFEKIAWLRKALEEQSSEHYLGLYLYEIIALKYLSNDFEEILPTIIYLDTVQVVQQKIIQPAADYLGAQLQDKMLEKRSVTINTIQNSYLNEEEKSILIINHIMWVGSSDSSMTQDSLNKLSVDFIRAYPHSIYASFVKENALLDYKESNWGFGFEFFSGYANFNGKLGDQFGGVVPIGVAFDIQYKKVVLYLRDYIGFSRTITEIPFKEDLWKKNEASIVYLPEATLGIQLIDNDAIKLVPFAGISSMSIGPPLLKSSDEEYDNVGLDFSSTPCMGINLDLKIRPTYNVVTNNKPEISYTLVKLRYTYHRPNYPSTFSGAFHSLTVGFGAFGRAVKRVQY